MAKYYGKIGFLTTGITRPGIWEETIKEEPYYGDIIRHSKMLQSSGGVNDDINVNMQISIVSNPFAYDNMNNIRYATYRDSKWKVNSVEIQFPRLILNLGGAYYDQEN